MFTSVIVINFECFLIIRNDKEEPIHGDFAYK